MRIRTGFVSNSSSTMFVIHNKTGEQKDLYDFAREVSYLVEHFNETYHYDYTVEQFLDSVAGHGNNSIGPHSYIHEIFGDEEGTVIGHILDYMLRDGGNTESFFWYFDRFFR